MSEMLINVETSKQGMEEIRPALDQALQKQFPGGMLQRRWEGDVLHLTGPGANGTVVFADGKLVGTAELKPPASMMRSVIEDKVSKALHEAAGA